jgi:hypothetical protein
MKTLSRALIVALSLISFPVISGTFTGELKLFPDGCQNTEDRKCKLEGMLTYTSSRNGLVWQTDEWEEGNEQSGTTDGASIPDWAQPIIGKPYDESYLKAAIVHDHYCYKENQVRTWEDTHLMFYDALIDLGVSKLKAKVMYFAVYWRGPEWGKLVPGEDCGFNCIKMANSFLIQDNYTGEEFTKQLAAVQKMVTEDPEFSLDELKELAIKLKGEDRLADKNKARAK